MSTPLVKVKKILVKSMLAARSLNLGSLAFSINPGKMVEYLKKVNETYRSFFIGPLRMIKLPDLLKEFGDSDDLFLPLKYVKPGSSPLSDVVVLAALARAINPKAIFEIGTFEGLTATVFAKNSPKFTKVNTLDVPSAGSEVQRTERSYSAQSISFEYKSGYLIDSYACGNKVNRILADSALFDFSPYTGTIDLFFVDGSHASDYVLIDSLNALECVSPNGFVAWHDAYVPDVLNVLKDLAKYHPMYIIQDTNIAISRGRPDATFPWHALRKKVKK